jgi:hypothetical protein
VTGGSYDYLCYRAVPENLEAMADRLAELAPGSAATRDTAALLALFRSEQLREVWRAVEWLDSNDFSEPLARDAIGRYEAAQEPPAQPAECGCGCVCRTAGLSWLRWIAPWRR